MWTGDLDNIEEVLLHLNTELQKRRSQKEIEIEDFGVNEKVIRNRLVRRGCTKNGNRWELPNRADIEGNSKVIKVQQVECDDSNTKVINTQESKYKEYDNSNMLIINDEKVKNNLINLAKNYDKIMSIVQQYDKEYDRQYDGMTIELPPESIKDFRTSIRVNNVIWEQFNKFVDAHKEFTKRDLMSMALKEYMNKYK